MPLREEDRENLLGHAWEDEERGTPAADSPAAGIGSRSLWDLFVHGPKLPREPKVTMWWVRGQTFPLRLKRRLPHWLRVSLFLAAFALWALIFGAIAEQSLLAEPEINGDTNVDFLRCSLNRHIWRGPSAQCGVDGRNCPIEPGTELRFKCPANCRRESWAYQPWPAGLHVSYHEPFVVGGSDGIYRADSFICAAALHQGIISDRWGGGGIVRFGGPRPNFTGGLGQEGMTALSFDSEFPLTFEFADPKVETINMKGVRDLRLYMIFTSICAVLFFGYFTTSAVVFLFTVVIIGSWTVIMASNPPLNGGFPAANAEVISLGFRRLLPCLLGTYVVWHVCTKPQLQNMPAYLSRAIIWAGPFFCGIVENYVFMAVPVDRLTVSDLNGQAGAWLAVFLIGAVIFCIAVGQSFVIWRSGRLIKYLKGYGIGMLGLALLACVPQQTLRIHHYILALCLLPGTAFQTTPSLAYQGLLVGLYVAGVTRWDFDSILQTSFQLARNGPVEDTTAVFEDPIISDSELAGLKNYVLQWAPLEVQNNQPSHPLVWDGFSLVINDVVRFVSNETSFNLTSWVIKHIPEPRPEVYYVRLAVAQTATNRTGPFTLGGVASITTGSWVAPLPGKV